jgi:glycerol-3-phosphate dehydrogenase
VCSDQETGQQFRLQSRCVINATGVWVDALRHADGFANPHDGRRPTKSMVAPSQGVHVVVERDFLGAAVGLMVPKTSDGRVLFAVPWLGKVILGTTDTPRDDLPREPRPFREELDFILGESARYLRKAPQPHDIKSIWVGLRPLVKPLDDEGDNTKGLSREHTVLVSRSNLVTVTGGKWTTYRAMAEDVLQKCEGKGLIRTLRSGGTQQLPLVGSSVFAGSVHPISDAPGLHSYGSDAQSVQALPGAETTLAASLTEAMVRFGARYEYARTVEDILARRSRFLFLDAALAAELAPVVGKILRQETGLNPQVKAFEALCEAYLTRP